MRAAYQRGGLQGHNKLSEQRQQSSAILCEATLTPKQSLWAPHSNCSSAAPLHVTIRSSLRTILLNIRAKSFNLQFSIKSCTAVIFFLCKTSFLINLFVGSGQIMRWLDLRQPFDQLWVGKWVWHQKDTLHLWYLTFLTKLQCFNLVCYRYFSFCLNRLIVF